MTLQQLKCLCEIVNQGLNLSRAARTLHTSQPAVTKMIRALEQELDVEILVRAGPRIVAVSDPGQEVLAFAKLVMRDVNNLRIAASDSRDATRGDLRIGTTHMQARYALVSVIQRFAAKYPEVHVNLRRGTPEEIANWASSGEVDIGVSTMPEVVPKNLRNLSIQRVSRCIIAPLGHPLLQLRKPTLADVAKYRLIAYDTRFTTGHVVERAFAAANITPRIAMKATDADVAKAYVSAGLGIAVIEEIAIDAADDTLRAVNADHLFPASSTWMFLRSDQYLRKFLYDFIGMVSPRWTRNEIDRARRLPPATKKDFRKTSGDRPLRKATD
jgi:DNA-binding transcriptional LysR family regulator